MRYPKVCVIILNWNGVTDTIECLESFKKIRYPNYQIIIVDNASTGPDVQVLQERYGDYVHIIANDKNYGFPEGNNIGFRYALNNGADYLMPLNNDVIVDPDLIDELIKVAEQDTEIGIVGSKIYYYYEPKVIECAGGKIFWWLGAVETYGGLDIGKYDTVAERDFLYANGCIIRKAVTEKISLFDPYYFFGIEEYDYCSKAKRAGYKIMYIPTARIWHKQGASAAKLPQHPKTEKLVKQKAGPRYYKYTYRLFKDNCPPVVFIFPFLMYTSLLGNLILSIWRGDWKTIKRGIARRFQFDRHTGL